MLRTVIAPNASPLTLDGTRTHLVGTRRLLIIDPGSDDPSHHEAIAGMVGDGQVTAVVVTHAHPDHEAGADGLAESFRCDVRMVRRGSLGEGDRLRSDAGDLTAFLSPGHTPDHVSLHWPEASAVFCGDLMMGGHDTALVAPPEGRLAAYLASLERIRRLRPRVIYPAHGPPFTRPGEALDRYVRHREIRLEQVESAVAAGATGSEELLLAVYGTALAPELRDPAAAALKAYLEHLQALGRVRRRGREWEAAQ